MKAQHRATGNHGDSAGMVLVMALMLMGAAVLLAVTIQSSAAAALVHEQRRLLAAELRAAATDSALAAVRRLAADRITDVDHTNEAWAAAEHLELPGGVRTETSVEDMQATLNLNNLAMAPQGPNRPDQESVVASALAEDGAFPNPSAAARSLRAWLMPGPGRNASRLFECPADAMTVLGSNRMSDTLSVLPASDPRPTPLNLNTASSAALTALLGPGSDALVRWALTMRQTAPFTSVGPLDAVLSPADRERFRSCFDVKSSYFVVRAAASKSGRAVSAYALVHRRGDGQVRIIRWVLR